MILFIIQSFILNQKNKHLCNISQVIRTGFVWIWVVLVPRNSDNKHVRNSKTSKLMHISLLTGALLVTHAFFHWSNYLIFCIIFVSIRFISVKWFQDSANMKGVVKTEEYFYGKPNEKQAFFQYFFSHCFNSLYWHQQKKVKLCVLWRII